MKRRAPILVAVLVGVAAALTLAWWLGRAPAGSDGRLTLYGNIEIRDAALAFNEQEHVAEVLAEEGDRVERGQVLARLVHDRLDAQLAEAKANAEAQRQAVRRLVAGTRVQKIEQARAEVAAADTRVRNARRNLARAEETAETGASSKQALDDARAALDVEQAELEVRKKGLDLALEGFREEDVEEGKALLAAREADVTLLEARLADTVLVAPAAGVIQSRVLEPGEMASPTRPAFVLALSDPKWVRAYVPEPDLGRIDLGTKAHVVSDSFPGETIDGWVGFISPVAEFTPKSVETTELRTQLVYEVRVYVDDPGDRLRLGMPVTVEVDRGSARHATDSAGRAAPPSRETSSAGGESR